MLKAEGVVVITVCQGGEVVVPGKSRVRVALTDKVTVVAAGIGAVDAPRVGRVGRTGSG